MPRQLSSLFYLLGLIVLTGLTLLTIRSHLQQIDTFILQLGWWGPLVIVLLFCLLSLSPVPTDPLSVMAGALYGPVIGFAISWIGNVAASLVEYMAARSFHHFIDFKKIRQQLPWGLSTAPVDSILFLTLGRITPGFGPKIVGLVSGLYQVPLFRYLWTSALINLVGSAIYVFGGHTLSRW